MTGDETTVFRAARVYAGGDPIRNAFVTVRNGQIDGVTARRGEVDGVDIDLGRVAVFPGQVNAHSHAFQRAIRGRTEYLSSDRPDDDFWSWREEMYRAALSLDPDRFEAVSRAAFLEMALAGYTTVGEFHYLHHDRNGDPYANPNELAERAVRAARDVGIRIRLLRTCYARSGWNQPPNPRQQRFVEPDLETYLSRYEELASAVDGTTGVEVGMAPHSIRAVPEPWLSRLAEYADGETPVHIHACEQPAEIEQSRAEYGRRPIEVCADVGLLGETTTVIHATHADDSELGLLDNRGAGVCVCPTTEANLGDGLPPAAEMANRSITLSLGSDSQIEIDPWREMRQLENHARLRQGERNVLSRPGLDDRPDGPPAEVSTAEALLDVGTRGGAGALSLEAGRLEEGAPADFVAVDLDAIALAGADEDSLLAHAVFSMPPSAVSDVVVGGRRIVQRGRHPDQREIVEAFERALD